MTRIPRIKASHVSGGSISYKCPGGNTCEIARTLFRYIASFLILLLLANNSYTQVKQLSPKGIIASHLYDAGSRLNGNNDPVTTSDFTKDRKNWIEIVDKRTEKSRTYKGVNGEIIIETGYHHLNYIDKNGKFIPVDIRLSPSINGWAALQQELPAYLNYDGSTELTIKDKGSKLFNENQTISFNKNCKINGKQINTENKSIQETEAFISSVIPNVDKKIVFRENEIESDYIIHSPNVIGKSSHLIISEEIEFPSDCYIVKDSTQGKEENGYWAGDYVVYSKEHAEKARFKTPVFYDSNPSNPSYLTGAYKLIRKENKNILEIFVPGNWLKDVARIYPVIIDPVVTGDTVVRRKAVMESCLGFPGKMDTMNITIPGGITITNFYVSDSYFADSSVSIKKRQGYLYYTTKCNSYVPPLSYWLTVRDSIQKDKSGTGFLNKLDIKDNLVCCFSLSCDPQTFTLNRYMARDSGGTGCNSTYVRYDPSTPNHVPFKAYIVGRTVESADSLWSVTPDTICSNTCSLTLKVSANYGILPYTITHPWMTGSKKAGKYITGFSCASSGTTTLSLTIPNCPTNCGAITSLSVPPPVITDSCGNKVSGLTAKTIMVKPLPVATANPNSLTICSGDTAKIYLSSCVTGTTYSWKGSNNSSGTGDISNVPLNPTASTTIIDYTITPVANNCSGTTLVIPVTVNPTPDISITPDNPNICKGKDVSLSASGASTYSWVPSTGLNKTTGTTVTANPDSTTIYRVTGKDTNSCTSSDSVKVTVTIPPTALVSSDTSICKMDTVKLSASGGTKYSWSPPIGLNHPDSSTTNASPGFATTYFVVVTDKNGCSNTGKVAITMRTDQPSVTASENIDVCMNDTVQLAATGSKDVTSYLWKPSQTLNNSSIQNPVAMPVATTTYIVDAWNGNCHAYDSVLVTVENPVAAFTPNPMEGLAPLHVNFTNNSTGADSYEWRFSETDSLPGKEPGYTYFSSGDYIVELTAISTHGCTSTVSAVIKVIGRSALWIPNSFTPGEDGINDVFKVISTSGIKTFSMIIFDRWGELVYESDSVNEGWDGKYKGEEAPVGVYVYILKATGTDNTPYNKTGHVTLLR